LTNAIGSITLGQRNDEEAYPRGNIMDLLAPVRLLGRLPHRPWLSHLVAWFLAALLILAWFSVWPLPVF